MPLLDRKIADDGWRWADIEVALMGVSRPTIEDLRAGGWRDSNWNPSSDHGYSVALAILSRLSAWPDSRQWIMRAIVAKAASFPESASLLAKDYSSDAIFSASLRTALNKHQPGAMYVVASLADDGHKTWLPEAIQSARELLRTPAGRKQTRAEELDRNAARTLTATNDK